MTQPLTDLYHNHTLKAYIENPDSLFPDNAAVAKPPANSIVITGQQIGLFGGPLYTLLKIASAHAAAVHATTTYGVSVQPHFWLEDNDHDAAEASTAWMPASDGVLAKHTLHAEVNRRPTSTLSYSTADVDLIHVMLANLDGRYAAETRDRFVAIYQQGTTWTQAFIHTLEPYLTAWTVNTVVASEFMRKAHHAHVVKADILSTDLVDAIHQRSAWLTERGLPLQAQPGSTLFFLTVDGERQRLMREDQTFRTTDGSVWNADELLEILETEPWRFTPTVLGRPLVQDYALPNIANVLGAAELSYHAQLVDAYRVLGIKQPQVLLRHHATILDGRTERNLQRLGMQASDLYAPLVDLESRLVAQDVDAALETLNTTNATNALLEPFRTVIAEVDPTLLKSSDATRTTIENQLEALRSKIRSAVKRKQSEQVERLRSAWWSVYPNATLAERILPLVVLESRHGIDGLRIIANKITEEQRHTFTTIGASSVQTHD